MSAKTAMSPPTDIINRWFPNGITPFVEIHRTPTQVGEGTWGTETSQYPEEYKSYEIPSVAASERGSV